LLAESLLISGCYATASLYPIEGPLSKAQPYPVLKATAYGIMFNNGTIEMTQDDGGQCKGEWSSIAPMSVGFSSKSQASSSSGGMASIWESVYGSGFSVSNLAGVNKGEAMLVCDDGTVYQVEFYTGSGTASGSGVAKDNKENIFKLLF